MVEFGSNLNWGKGTTFLFYLKKIIIGDNDEK